jgi:membrane protease YdiL (CAAX protease family)
MRRVGLFVAAFWCNPIVTWVQRLMTPAPSLEVIDEFMSTGHPAAVAVFVVLVVLVVPVCEELLFRGLCWRVLRLVCSARVAGVVIALVFAALHGWPAAIWLLPLSMALSYLRSTGTLGDCIAAHVGWNSGAILLPMGLAWLGF